MTLDLNKIKKAIPRNNGKKATVRGRGRPKRVIKESYDYSGEGHSNKQIEALAEFHENMNSKNLESLIKLFNFKDIAKFIKYQDDDIILDSLKNGYEDKDVHYYLESIDDELDRVDEDEAGIIYYIYQRGEESYIPNIAEEIVGMLDDKDYFTIGGEDFRIMSEDDVEQAYENLVDEIIDADIYGYGLDKLPDFLRDSFDREKIARELKYDGVGHNFNSYDGSAEEIGDYYVMYMG